MTAAVPQPVWPDNLVDVTLVRDWIAVALAQPGHDLRVLGPVEVYQQKAWGITARFQVEPPVNPPAQRGGNSPPTTADVVFKACDLPLFAAAPAIHRALLGLLPEQVPTLLASATHGEQTWSLFRPFPGLPLATPPTINDLCNIAQTTAAIQARSAMLPAQIIDDLPRFPVSRIPACYDEILADISDWHLTQWYSGGQPAAQRFNLPADLLAVLTGYRAYVAAWTEELSDSGWPDTIDHVDLRAGNARRLADGHIFLYDWEEAVISCPFFSLDRLLDEAQALDRRAAAANVTINGTALCGSPSEQAVRRAYLDALPWQTTAARERAFDLALCLAPLKFAHECKAFTQALGWDHQWSTLTAFSLSRALQRWQSLHDKYGSEIWTKKVL